jgi:hypothetical protein
MLLRCFEKYDGLRVCGLQVKPYGLAGDGIKGAIPKFRVAVHIIKSSNHQIITNHSLSFW